MRIKSLIAVYEVTVVMDSVEEAEGFESWLLCWEDHYEEEEGITLNLRRKDDTLTLIVPSSEAHSRSNAGGWVRQAVEQFRKYEAEQEAATFLGDIPPGTESRL